MVECERIAHEEFGMRTMRVTSGVGVRGYYRTLGYELRRRTWCARSNHETSLIQRGAVACSLDVRAFRNDDSASAR